MFLGLILRRSKKALSLLGEGLGLNQYAVIYGETRAKNGRLYTAEWALFDAG